MNVKTNRNHVKNVTKSVIGGIKIYENGLMNFGIRKLMVNLLEVDLNDAPCFQGCT